jgi:uncharacterized repeat protein (TIGR02543 family)
MEALYVGPSLRRAAAARMTDPGMTVNRRSNARGLVVATIGLVLGFAASGPAARAAWEVVGTAGFSAGAADYTSLAFYNGEPYVAYEDGANGSKATVMRYTSGSWQTVGAAAFSAGSASYTSLAFYNAEPYVAYVDAGNGSKATVKRYTAGSWQTVGAAGFSAGSASYTSLAFYNGEPYVAYLDVANANKATVMRYTGGSWQTVGAAGFSASTAPYTSLAFYNGEPYVAYLDTGNGARATVKRYTGGSWQTVGAAGFSASAAPYTSLAFYNGEPYVAYEDVANSSKAMAMRYTGGSWQTVGAAGFSASTASYTSLAFYNGEPYVAYVDAGSGSKATVKRYTGGSWQTVGTAGFSAGSATYTSLAFDNDEPYVAYKDAGNGNRATVMRYPAPPTIQATNVMFSSVGATAATIDWTRGNGSGCVAFVKQASSGSAVPANNTTYTAGAVFGTGTQIGATGWYCVYNGSGTNITVTGLSPGTTYRVMVCEYDGVAGNEQYFTDTAAGNPANVTTNTTPTVTTAAVSGITTTTAACGGNVAADGGANVTARGVCWSTSANPTTADDKTNDGTGTGAFVSSLTCLSAATAYHVRAYATNSAGTAYGSEEIFTTVAVHTVTFQAGAHGTLTGTTSQTVNYGSNCTAVTPVPDLGYHFTGWTGDYVGSENPLTVTNVTADMTITASFAIDTHTVTFQAGAHGSLTGTTPQTVNYGANCTPVTPVPDLGYHFTGWTGDYVGNDNPLTITNVTADMTITASFAIDTHTVTFQAGAHGSLTGTTPQTVNYGSNCTPVTPVPDLGYHFTGWTGDYVGSDNPLTVTNVTADMTVTASFALLVYTVTFAAEAGGSVQGAATQVVPYGAATAPVTAIPADGWAFVRWNGRDGFESEQNPLTLTDVRHSALITATFAILPPEPADAGETPSPSPEPNTPAGDDKPDLRLTIAVSPTGPAAGGTVATGDVVPLELAVENVGAGSATDVRLVVPIPDSLEYVSARVLTEEYAQAAPAQVEFDGRNVIVHVGDVAPGHTVAAELMLRAKTSGVAAVAAQVHSTEQQAPVAAQPAAEIVVEDEYYLIQSTSRPGGCGLPGLFPLFTLVGLLGLRRYGKGGV